PPEPHTLSLHVALPIYIVDMANQHVNFSLNSCRSGRAAAETENPSSPLLLLRLQTLLCQHRGCATLHDLKPPTQLFLSNGEGRQDRKSTRLNSSHVKIS